ncbi:hypothetical protein JL720_325 [Aureococcus anophagefferens]|nr:hypothetical protein JL720_325 [Aureococcus anophagefferens]
MSTLVSSTTTTAAAAASNAATLYAVLLEKCGPAAAAAAGWAQERYLLFVDAAVLRFDDGLALLDPAQANYVRDVAAASQDVVASLARFLASLWALAGLVVVPAARRAVALFRRQPEEWQLAEVGVLLFLYALWRFRRWVRTSETLRAVAAELGAARRAYDARVLEARRAYASALKKLAEKSRVAASALPHALYVAAVLGGRRVRTVRRRPRSPRSLLVLVARLYGADAALRKWAAAQSDEPNPEPPPPSPPASPPAPPARDEPEGAAAVYYRTREQLRQRKPKPKVRRTTIAGAADVAASRERTLTLRRRFAADDARRRRRSSSSGPSSACWFCRGAAHALPFAPSDFRSSKLGSVAAAGAEARGAALVWLSLGAPRPELAFAALAAIAGRWAPPDDRPPPPSPRSARRGGDAEWWRRATNLALARRRAGTLLETALGDRYAGLRDHVAEVASDADGWRAAAVGCFAAMTVGPVARSGAVAVGFGVPVLATLRCVRAPRATALGDAKMLRYLAFWAAVGLRDALLLNDSIHRIHAWVPLRSHLEIFLFLYLQLPYFRGAQRLHARAQAKLADVARRMRD